FFFSSRRRHTILVSDWSSDVCSSDLVEQALERSSAPLKSSISVVGRREKDLGPRWQFAAVDVTIGPASTLEIVDEAPECQELRKIGRTSGREREERWGGCESVRKGET